MKRIDRSRPDWPREIDDEHIEADDDHCPVPHSNYEDGISDICTQCGLATTSDGKRHGYDAR